MLQYASYLMPISIDNSTYSVNRINKHSVNGNIYE